MAKKKLDKKIECFSASFNNILICQKNDAKPFIEVFVEDPENITQQNLGILAGILEITDESEDSSYIVNYLISVIKKEYYSKPKRGVIESFEAALKKANLALAKLAEHENISWIGKTNAILLVIDKNNLHLSQSGSARALLLRGKTLTDISEDPALIDPPNPIKTFTDIVSGRLEENDKLIVTTESMFDLFSMEEIKRSALKFSSPEFIQFLKTALVNESERAATLVIEIKKETRLQNETAAAKSKSGLNAFSQSAFSKKAPAKTPVPAPLGISAETYAGNASAEKRSTSNTNAEANDRQLLVNEIKEELAKDENEFVDKKTGHIYIKGGYPSPEEDSKLLDTLGLWQDKFFAYLASLMEFFAAMRAKRREGPAPKVSDPEKSPAPSLENEVPQKATVITPKEKIEFLETPAVSEKIPVRIKLEGVLSRGRAAWKENYPKLKNFSLAISTQFSRLFQMAMRTLFQKTQSAWKSIEAYRQEKNEEKEPLKKSEPTRTLPTLTSEPEEKKNWMEKYSEKLAPTNIASRTSTPYELSSLPAKIAPNLTRLKNILAEMNYSQRIYAALAVVLLFVVPYFIAKIGANPKPSAPNIPQEAPPAELTLSQDKLVTRVEKMTAVYSGENVLDIINLNDVVFAVSARGVVDIANNVFHPFPESFIPVKSAGMDDINFIFFLDQNNRLLSWSPVSKKFQENTADIPTETKVADLGTYLTYLYVLDSAKSQIYRYPRDTGGFGQKAAWLKDTADLSKAESMSIGENIYLTDSQNVLKFFQGKKQNFQIETTATPITATALYTKRDSQALYILDKTNARIVKTDLNGQIVAQYHNADLAKTINFTVDEKNNSAYISTDSGVGTFKMN